MLPVATPRPWLFSILFFVIELHLLLEAGRTARPRLLLLLVPLFWLWANVHIEFTLGLLVSGRCGRRTAPGAAGPAGLGRRIHRISAGWLLLVFLLCCGATLLNPYHVRLYATAVQLLGQTGLWNVISELQAMQLPLACRMGGAGGGPGRRRGDRRAAAGAAAAGVALSAGRILQFPFAAGQWMRAHRGPLAGGQHQPRPAPCPDAAYDPRRDGPWPPSWPRCSLGSLLTLDEARLEAQVAQEFPAQAVAFLRQGSYEGPLYNTFMWGGYLIFHYPEHPVCIDGRTLIHGTARIVHSVKMQNGEDGWQSDPELAAARLLILPRKAAIALLLRLDARFQVVYEDSVAVVFVRR